MPILSGKKPSLGDFVETTDNEILFMIRNYARDHVDETLRYLSRLFLSRRLPKCILDSSRRNTSISTEFNITLSSIDSAQKSLWSSADPKEIAMVANEIQNFIEPKMSAIGAPKEAAKYLVSLDKVSFRSDPPADLLFSFHDETVPLEQINGSLAGFDVHGLLEQFSIYRLFVPSGLEDDVKEFLADQFGRCELEVALGG